MIKKRIPKLNSRKKYLQIAINSSLHEAYGIIRKLPASDRIILEAGTPFIKRYGESGIRSLKNYYSQHLAGSLALGGQNFNTGTPKTLFGILFEILKELNKYSLVSKGLSKPSIVQKNDLEKIQQKISPYIVADLKMMDRGETEVEIAWRGGADAAVALGHAPTESLNAFIEKCGELDLDSMIDMMNVEYPLNVLSKLKKQPDVVILHRGVDEGRFNKSKGLPLHEIRRIKGRYDVMISVAGGDTAREVQSVIFNDADIVIVWENFYRNTSEVSSFANEFLKAIK